jgi:RNA polymerase sigma factor (sigma-70 family)
VNLESAYIQQVISGDVSRFSYFVTTYKDMAFTIAIRILENQQDAEEVVQDSFVKAYRSIKSYKGNSKFSTWLYRIVVNTALSRAGKNKAKRSYQELELAEERVEGVESAYKKLATQDQVKYINLAMERLNTEDRLILTLYHLDEQSIEEISDITGISRENIKMRLHRARKKMYGILSGFLKTEVNLI